MQAFGALGAAEVDGVAGGLAAAGGAEGGDFVLAVVRAGGERVIAEGLLRAGVPTID